ncbi:MAG: tRNA lysidine(34) synthetase TilS [Pseudobdellovibrio sp.]
MSSSWSSFEHLIWKNLKSHGLEDQNHFLLAVSGGLDSMVLLELFFKLKPQAQIKVVHYHHGNADDQKQFEFRNACQKLVEERAKACFFTEKSVIELKSEEQFRDARWAFIKKVKDAQDVVVTAHHLDDKLENVLLKLIRGTSLEGVSQFKMWNGQIFRPLLNVTKKQILDYAETENLKWLEDPSNQDTKYLRNWIREKWLVDLDNYQNGTRENLAKSLFQIIESPTEGQEFELSFASNSNEKSMNRQWYSLLSKGDQLRALAKLLKTNQIYDFSTGQLEEIRKRLDKNQKDLTFEILGRKWVINASQIVLE